MVRTVASAGGAEGVPLLQQLADLECDPEVGLASAEAANRRDIFGANKLSPPHGLPQWLCCLLPCLLQTESMRLFEALVAESAIVRRGSRWITMDSASLVPGDVVQVKEGERVPADVRVLRYGPGGLECDARDVLGKGAVVRLEGPGGASAEGQDADGTVLLMGAFCRSGAATCVVTETGDETVLAQRIDARAWPPRDAP